MVKRRSTRSVNIHWGERLGRLRGKEGVDVVVGGDGNAISFRRFRAFREEVGEAVAAFDSHDFGSLLMLANFGMQIQNVRRVLLVGIDVDHQRRDFGEPEVHRVPFVIHLEDDHPLAKHNDGVDQGHLHRELELLGRAGRVSLGEGRELGQEIHFFGEPFS